MYQEIADKDRERYKTEMERYNESLRMNNPVMSNVLPLQQREPEEENMEMDDGEEEEEEEDEGDSPHTPYESSSGKSDCDEDSPPPRHSGGGGESSIHNVDINVVKGGKVDEKSLGNGGSGEEVATTTERGQ